VLFAALAASLDERFHEGALLRVLGASPPPSCAPRISQNSPCSGVLAGILAAIGTELIAYLLYTRAFELEYSFKWPVWLAAPLAGGVLIGLAGYIGTRRVVIQSPLAVLREYVHTAVLLVAQCLRGKQYVMKQHPGATAIPLRTPLFRGERRLRIALVGMPNSGKSTLFQAYQGTVDPYRRTLRHASRLWRNAAVQIGLDEARVYRSPEHPLAAPPRNMTTG